MRTALVLLAASLLLSGCQKEVYKVLVGGTVIASPGATPIHDSVVVISRGKIRSLGTQQEVSIPQNADRTDLDGAWILPAPGETIDTGKPADLLIVHKAPTSNATPGDPSDVGARMVNGEWQLK